MEEKIEQNVLLYNRNKLEISGVCDVSEFCETSIELCLCDACIGIDGDQLKIDFFSSDSGLVSIRGTLNAITYYTKLRTSKKAKKKKF